MARAIVFLVLAGCTSASDPGGGATATSPAPRPITLEGVAVVGLEIDEPDWKAGGANWRLELSWGAPDGVTIDHYEVRRDGVTVDSAVDSTAFGDDDVEPGARYRYEVVGIGADGAATDPATASIKTGEPKVSEARLAGTFAVRLVVQRASGTESPAQGGAISFVFDPSCRSGPCSVRWTVRSAKTEGMLRRDDAVYSASVRTPLFVRTCFDTVIDEEVSVRLRVISAAPLRNEWRATKIRGTIGEVSSYRGCATAKIHWSVRGTLQN
jgi:hypothetical protein